MISDEDYEYVNTLNEEQTKFLEEVAYLFNWWQTTEDAMKMPYLLVAKILNRGQLKEVNRLLELFSKEYLEKIIKNASIGQFTLGSWYFWHANLLKMKYSEIPPMPKRFPD